MGQSCSSVELNYDRNSILVQNSMSSLTKIIGNELKARIQYQKQVIKNVTYIENSDELIYQIKDQLQSVEHLKVEHLKVQKWIKQDKFEELHIQRFINDKSFVVRVKQFDKAQFIWKIFTVIQVPTLQSRNIFQFAIFYYNMRKIKQIPKLSKQFIFAQNCSIKISQPQLSGTCFIVQSQFFENDVISLKQLGKYMKNNNIYWQDQQFTQIIKRCYKRIDLMHSCNYYLFEDFLIDKRANIYCMGGLIGSNQILEQKIKQDFDLLSIYLIEVLFGIDAEVYPGNQLLNIIKTNEQQSKFKHQESLKILMEIFKGEWNPNKFQKQDDQKKSNSNIQHYVGSYKIKTSLEASNILFKHYVQLGQYIKAKQVLFAKLSFAQYNQKKSPKQIFNRVHVLSNIGNQHKATGPQMEESFQILEKLIVLETKISQTNQNHQLFELRKQYLFLAILLSYNSRKNGDYPKSLFILERVQTYLTEEDPSWLLALHQAENYLFAGKLQLAERYFYKSIKIQINQANLCFFVKFYTTVLNWEKAIQLIREYQALIAEQYVYDLLISKCFLAKALCISPRIKKSQEQRNSNLFQCLKIIRRVLERKNISKVILSQTYQTYGDVLFYLMRYEEAKNEYEKCIAILSSIDYRHKSSTTNQDQRISQPGFIRLNSVQNSKSFYPHEFQQYLNLSTIEKSQTQAFNLQSFISQSQSRHLSFNYQLKVLFNTDRKAVLHSSVANCYFMQRKYQQAIKKYQQSRNITSLYNEDLKNSILGNMAICITQMGKNAHPNPDKTKINEGKNLLIHILDETSKQYPQKIQNDVNYIFLAQQLSAD